MDEQTLILFRIVCLQVLITVPHRALPVGLVLGALKCGYFPQATEQDCKTQLEYLADHRQALRKPSPINEAVTCYQIDDLGRKAVKDAKEEGLIS